MDQPIKIGAMISGGGTNLQAIINSCESGKIDGEMVFIGSDNPSAKGLVRAVKHSIPTFTVDYSRIIKAARNNPGSAIPPDDFNMDQAVDKQSFFPDTADPEKVGFFLLTRAVAEADLIKNMKEFEFDLLVLAGFMRNLTPYFIDRINKNRATPRIMNIHPALLPSFPGVDGYGDTFRYGCKVGGCTVHFIDYGEDSGPIIGQRSFPIDPEDTLADIKEKGLKKEWELYPECIQLFAENRLKVESAAFQLNSGKTVTRDVVKIIKPS